MPSYRSSDPLLGSPGSDDDQLSPTDGYFSTRQQDQELHAGPSAPGQKSTQSEASSPIFTPSTSEAGWGSQSGSARPEQQPLLRHNTPPPNYARVDPTTLNWQAATPATTPVQGSSDQPPRFLLPKVSLPSTDDLPEWLTDLDIKRWLQERTSHIFSRRLRREKRRQKLRKSCAKLLKVLLVFIVIVWVVAFLIGGKGIFGWASVCLVKEFVSRSYQIPSLDYFDFSDTDQQNSGLPRGFSGVMNIITGPSDQKVDLNVVVRSVASDLQGGKNDSEWRPTSLISCAEVTLHFRPTLEITNLRIASKNMRLMLSSNIVVTESTTISVEGGNLGFDKFDSSRVTYINARNSAVRGTLGLLDVLSIQTQSGSVSVDISPQPASKDRPKPALLEIQSKSGSVNVNYPRYKSNVPDRDYRSTISSRSGSVSGHYLHGKETTLESVSGSLNVQIVPYGFHGEASSLTTKSESGASTIELLKPNAQHGDPFKKMSSVHSARSGSLRLKYPKEWQGDIYGEAQSGSLSLSGRGVEIISEGNEGGKRYVQAVKGNGTNTLDFDIKSGSADVTVGY